MSTYFDVFLNFCLTPLLLTPPYIYVPIFPPPDSFMARALTSKNLTSKRQNVCCLFYINKSENQSLPCV